MAQKGRNELQGLFQTGAKPSQQDFADLIESTLNIKEDGIEKPGGAENPLKITAQGADEKLLDFYADQTKTWSINQKPGEKSGLNIANAAGTSKLFIDSSSGNVGLSIDEPKATLHIQQTGNEDALRIDDESKNTTAFFIDKDGNVGIGTASPGAKLEVDGDVDIKGTIKGPANDYQKAQFTMSGGGKVTWGGPGGRLKWTNEFIAISMERGATFKDGRINIKQPTQNIPADYVYDDNPEGRSANAEGVILNDWEALYAVHTPGGNQEAVSFRIVHYGKSFNAPSNWLLVAVVNGEDKTLKLGTGTIIAAKSSSDRGSSLPSGTILMWSGKVDNIPDGWALCDGLNGTPDLRGRFILASGQGANLTNHNPGTSGGVEKVTLTTNHLPTHSHGLSNAQSGWLKNVTYLKQYQTSTLAYNDIYDNDEDRNDHRRETVGRAVTSATQVTSDLGFNASQTTNNAGGGQEFSTMPPFYALVFIMKT